MASYTEHYGLHQWEPGDNFLRTDFNTDFEKIDAALNHIFQTADGRADVVNGTYTGDGAAERAISLGFQPKALYLCTWGGVAGHISGSYRVYGGLAFPGHPIVDQGHNDAVAVEITGTGFQLHQDAYRCVNDTDVPYYYVALR